jgi:hypothetical protein
VSRAALVELRDRVAAHLVEIEPELQELPPAPMPPPPSAALKWLHDVLAWAEAVGAPGTHSTGNQ